MNEALQIRPGEAGDLAALTTIYNHYITETHITFDTDPFPVGARTHWFTQFAASGPHQLYVGTVDDTVVGYTTSTPFKDRAAYRTSVETTVYLHPDYTQRGYGRQLYGHLLAALEAAPDVHRAYGGVALPNPASIALHERFGYKQVATYTEVGFKFDRYWDVIWFEKEL